MGCDIHLFVERRDGDAWEFVPATEHSVCDPDQEFEPEWFEGRDYATFGVLAGVRGWLGVDPISEPRGVPGDATDEYLSEVERKGTDGHSHSWLMLSEVLAFPWCDHEECSWFAGVVLPRLERVGPAEDVRLVFFFDS